MYLYKLVFHKAKRIININVVAVDIDDAATKARAYDPVLKDASLVDALIIDTVELI